MADQGTEPGGLALLSLAIGLGSVVLGILVRYGHAWVVTVNVVAVAGFLEVTTLTVLGFVFAAIDVFVLLALFRERPWFTWSPEQGYGDDEADQDDDR